ncbi:hypothetical protein HNQ91_004762 [Filimonas zeae]|uniref:hypothetical protein n=1 Tax=Filimonas zeae TaxID=1737353 RepID=UPI001666E87E|nr:hypothetical protein [Filimonas zeae]MDR6341689.1 hypothetical protein [Filimonas zeae]
MKYSLLYKIFMCTLVLAITITVKAQQKVPDMTRYSKAPLAPASSAQGGSAKMSKSGVSGRRTTLESFNNAPIQGGGGTKAGFARKAARAATIPANIELPSNAKPSAGAAQQKSAAPVIPDAIQEQLNMKPESAPASKAAGNKPPAAAKS